MENRLKELEDLKTSLEKQYKEEKNFIWRMQILYSLNSVKKEIKKLEYKLEN